MSLEGLVITLTILIVAGLWIGAPLLSGKRRRSEANGTRQRDRLLTHYDRLLTNLRDLDEDYATGKIQPADYEQEREEWVQNGVQILMALDSLNGAASSTSDGARIDEAVDAEIEAAVAAYRRHAKAH